MSDGIQWSVPVSRPRTASLGRAERRVRSASERIMARTTPCSMPIRATTRRVVAARPNSMRSKRRTARSSLTRSSFVAMNTSMARGRYASGAVATSTTARTMTAAMVCASWERAPDAPQSPCWAGWRPPRTRRPPGGNAAGPDADQHEDAHRDPSRPSVDVAQLAGHRADPADSGGSPAGHPEDDRDLADDNLDGDTGQEPVDDRGGEELCDPPQAAEADHDQQRRPAAR